MAIITFNDVYVVWVIRPFESCLESRETIIWLDFFHCGVSGTVFRIGELLQQKQLLFGPCCSQSVRIVRGHCQLHNTGVMWPCSKLLLPFFHLTWCNSLSYFNSKQSNKLPQSFNPVLHLWCLLKLTTTTCCFIQLCHATAEQSAAGKCIFTLWKTSKSSWWKSSEP